MGLRLRKYIELKENWAADNYRGPDRRRRLIASVGRVYYRPRRERVRLHTAGEVWYIWLPRLLWTNHYRKTASLYNRVTQNSDIGDRGYKRRTARGDKSAMRSFAKVIWQKAASPTCHSSRLRMDLSNTDLPLSISMVLWTQMKMTSWSVQSLCTVHPRDYITHRPRYVRHQ